MNQPHFTSESQTGTRRRSRTCLGTIAFDMPETRHHQDPLQPSTPGVDRLREIMNSRQTLDTTRLTDILSKISSGAYLTRCVAENCAQQMLDEESTLS